MCGLRYARGARVGAHVASISKRLRPKRSRKSSRNRAVSSLAMKVGIVGAGRVGAACALSLVTRGSAREIVIVDRTQARARAVVADLRYGAPLCPTVALRDGDYPELAGADLVMVTSGLNENSAGATHRGRPNGRLKLPATD